MYNNYPKIRSDSKQFNLPVSEIRKLPKNKNYNLLDIGSESKYLKQFLPKNIKYQSLDCTGEPNIKFNLDNGKMPIKDNTYDVIVCLETLEHVLYPHRVMQEIIRIAKSDAIFLLSIPNEYNFYCRFNFLIGKKTEFQQTFNTTEKNLHIHSPRAQDTLRFFSQYIKIQKIDYPWYSRTSFHNKGIKKKLSLIIDPIIRILTKFRPSLFTRSVVVKGIKKS